MAKKARLPRDLNLFAFLLKTAFELIISQKKVFSNIFTKIMTTTSGASIKQNNKEKINRSYKKEKAQKHI